MLIIDDDKEFLFDLKLLFQDQENCIEAGGSKEALRIFKKHPADVCLVDVQLPSYLSDDQNLEGIYLAKEIMKESSNNSHIIFMSQHDLPELKNLPFSYHFLKKPFHINQLFEIIQQYE